MGVNSKIEWTHHTFNPWWGCLRISPACKHCYAETWAKRVGMNDLWGKDAPRRFFTDAHWREPLKWDRDAAAAGERRRVFCASMADVFEDRRDLNEARERLWALIEATPNLDWLLLTKRIRHVRKLAPWSGKWPENIWLGTSTENQNWLEKRVDHLLQHNVVVRFVSAEPLLGPLNLRPWLQAPGSAVPGINWVIAGGESGPESRSMNPAWPEDLRDQCNEANVPFHFKQWGHWAPEELIAEGISARAQRIDVVGRDGAIIRLVKVGKAKGGRELGGTTWDQVPVISGSLLR
ncbi:protein gp37 [Duganella sacchari]|uniref:Protein gp37 n=1 Tax=Duganella sacchari TaxID=551987 RepID=A0A1M7REC5_9BURK|nr:phage Gp37/Gp68 family protein [Duganella sacchari]SHN44560.1 protein gp37 [Duganella sacchari]